MAIVNIFLFIFCNNFFENFHEKLLQSLRFLCHFSDLVQCSPHVGFTLTLDVNLTVAPEEIIKFDYIMYNEGQGYDPETGYFTAPVGGMYLFFVQ